MADTPIILAEDNPRERRFLATLLRDYPLIESANGAEVLQASLAQAQPWLISDLQMPEINGIELARRLWSQRPEARIIFWSHHKDETYVRSLSKIVPPDTVYGYVLKDNAAEILLKAVAAVFMDHQCWVDPLLHPVQVRTRASQSALTDAEYEALIDIALGLTDYMIAQRHYLSRRGAQSRLKSLYSKLGIEQQYLQEDREAGEVYNMRARALAIALERGLVNPFELKAEEAKFQAWLRAQPGTQYRM